MPTTKKSLPAKLSEIMGKLARVEKKGFNRAQNYAFAREADVAAAASTLFAEYNIFVTMSLVDDTRLTPLFKTRSGSEMFLTELTMEYTFYDGDSDATIGPLRFPGAGADTGDKGIYKALTGSEKYFLMKTFLISTGDDPEADDKVDKEAAGAAAGAGSRIKGGKAKADTKKGGKTTGSTKAQTEEIKRLIKAKGMTPVTLLVAVSEALDTPLAPGADPKDVLAALSAEEMGKVIQYISEMVEIVDEDVEELSEPGHDAGGDGEQEALDIV